jgi:hypothetical protein
MSELVADCPRCGASRITFDLVAATETITRYGWQQWYEAFCVCRHCSRPTIYKLADEGTNEARFIRNQGLVQIKGAVNHLVRIEGTVTLKDTNSISPPEHLPESISAVFAEGATCLAVECFNAAGTMFRLCVDLATKSLLPQADRDGLNSKIRRNLGLRLPWLFEQRLLPEALSELSSCIKEDGNDGAHEGSLKKEDAEDLLDFTVALLERMYTEPERLRLAKERRDQRRNG